MKIWGLIPITKGQFIIIETIFISFFFLMTIFFFSYRFPEYVTDSTIIFHTKYLKYVCLLITFLLIIETQYYLNRFIHKQLEINKAQKREIEEQKDSITSSIQYASRIQSALLPPSDEIPDNVEHFIYYKPKDIVSGDYYWLSKKDNKTIFVAADCTGHGVPGAFMSAMGIAYLNEIVNTPDSDYEAHEILNKLRKKVINAFYKSKTKTQDGMDMALCILDSDKQELQYAGAFNPMLVVRKFDSDFSLPENQSASVKRINNNKFELLHYKANRMPISLSPHKKSFSSQTIQLFPEDTIYIFSDGYVDQFGGEKGSKFFIKRFKKLLLDIQESSMLEQKEILIKNLENWRHHPSGEEFEQLDDILVMGLRFKEKV